MEELIQLCQQGDRVAMGQLYTAMHDRLLAHCRKYTANDNIAEDLLHDAFLLIFSNIDKLHSPEKGRQWMHKVVRNVCLLYVQHRQDLTLVSIDEVQETAQNTEQEIALTYDDILNAIDQLPRGYRQVFRLSVLEGLTHQQIAGLLGIEPHTSSSQLLRAKRQLRQMLQVLMFFLLAAVPFGVYYYWSAQNNSHNMAKDAGNKPTAPIGMDTVTDTTICPAETGIKENIIAEKSKKDARTVVVVEDERAENSEVVVSEKVLLPEKEIAQNTEKDTTILRREQTIPALPFTTIGRPHSDRGNGSEALSLAYNGMPNGSIGLLPFGAEGMNGDIDSVTHHHMPVTVALNARYSLDSNWWLEGALRYTLLSSETRVGNTYLFVEQQQHVRYLGLSLGVGRNLWHRQHWSLYTTTSLTCDLPLHSTERITYWQGGQRIDTENHRLAPHTQWSLGMSIGLQYNITPTIGLFAEPYLQYHFRPSDGISTWFTDHPLFPSLPMGIRMTFGR